MRQKHRPASIFFNVSELLLSSISQLQLHDGGVKIHEIIYEQVRVFAVNSSRRALSLSSLCWRVLAGLQAAVGRLRAGPLCGGADGVGAQPALSGKVGRKPKRIQPALRQASPHARFDLFSLTSIVPIPSSNEEIRLVDDAFGKISHMVSDGSWMVRVQAAKTLVRRLTPSQSEPGTTLKRGNLFVLQGSMLQVSPHFLEQTLDKKLMSDLRVSQPIPSAVSRVQTVGSA